jgi:hypothetical protein
MESLFRPIVFSYFPICYSYGHLPVVSGYFYGMKYIL